MALVKKSNKPTNFVLPVVITNSSNLTKLNWYYECEADLFKAYYQLKRIKGYIKPLYPVIYS